jgi:fructose-1-phosphate kinase PfkB-like protein
VKPNEHELAQWWGKPLRSESAIVQAARELSGVTRGWVLVSRGSRRSLLANRTERLELFAQPLRVIPLNTVGAGDALLAAVAWQIELGAPPDEWLRWGVAAGTAATQCEAGELPGRALIDRFLREEG